MSSALFHVQFGAVQPSRGDSLRKVAAYNAAARMGEFDFTRKRHEHIGGVLLLPPDAPAWARDPAQLWTAAEAAETRIDGQPARLVEFAIPREIRPEDRLDFARAVAEAWANEGAAVQLDLHCPRATDGGEQPHAHAILSRRALGPDDGFSKKKLPNVPWTKNKGRDMRAAVAQRMNNWLAAHGYESRVDHRRAAEHGDPVPPEKNVGRRSFEALKRQPDSPAARPARRVIAERQTRRRLRAATQQASRAAHEVQALTHHQEAQKMAQKNRRRNTFAAGTLDERKARQQRLFAALMREHYETGWLPTSVLERISRVEIDKAARTATIHLEDGNKLIDYGDRIELQGRVTEAVARETALAAQRHGWSAVELTGSADYKRAVARQLAILEPPINDISGYELDDDDRAWIAEQRQQLTKLNEILGPEPEAHSVRPAAPQQQAQPAAEQDGPPAWLDDVPTQDEPGTPARRLSREAAVAWLVEAESAPGRTPAQIAALRDAQAAAADGNDGVLAAVEQGDLRVAAIAARRWKEEQERRRKEAAERAAQMEAEPNRTRGPRMG